MTPIKLFDVVMLKTKSTNDPKMVVTKEYDTTVTCCWFSARGEYCHANFFKDILVKVG